MASIYMLYKNQSLGSTHPEALRRVQGVRIISAVQTMGAKALRKQISTEKNGLERLN